MNQILCLPSAELTADFDRSILHVTFIGDVKFPEYKKVLLEAAELVRSKGVQKVLMDRRQINKVDAECRVWAKNEYVKVHIKPLIPKLTKVAVVDSKSIVGQLYGKAIYQTFSLIYPTLAFKFFGHMESASKWLDPAVAMEAPNAIAVKDRPAQQARKRKKQTPLQTSEQSTGEIMEVVNEEAAATRQVDEKTKASVFEKIFNALFPKFG